LDEVLSMGVVEMAQCCGLASLSPRRRDPLNTTSFGLGDAIQHCKEKGVRKAKTQTQ
jgi:glycerate kinase